MKQLDREKLLRLGPLTERGWLSEQPFDFQLRIAAAGRWADFERGQLLYDVGDPSETLYGLGSGAMDVSLPIKTDECVTIHRAEPGSWIGDSGLLARTKRSITVRSSAQSRIFCIPAAAIRAILRDHPGDWQYFYMLSHVNATAVARILAETLSMTPRALFARTLLRLADEEGQVRLTQEDLSRLAGMSRATFRRTFAELIDLGAVETGYGGLRIRDAAALQEVIAMG
jgi:CRP-like cAMP-binding protein